MLLSLLEAEGDYDEAPIPLQEMMVNVRQLLYSLSYKVIIKAVIVVK